MSKSQSKGVSETPEDWPDGMFATCKSKSRSGSGGPKYHTRNCLMIPDDPKFMRKEICRAWDNFVECKYCTGEADMDEIGSGSPHE